MPGKKRFDENKTMILWFDLRLTHKEIYRLEKLGGKRTQMEYVEEALREKMDRDERAHG